MAAPEPNALPNPVPPGDDDEGPKAEPEPNPEATPFAPKAPKGLDVLGLAPPRAPNGDAVDPDSAPNFELAKRLDDEEDELPLDPKILLTPEPAAVANGDLAEEFANPLFSGSCTRGTNRFVSTQHMNQNTSHCLLPFSRPFPPSRYPPSCLQRW